MVRTAVEAFLALLLFGCIPVTIRSISANPYTIGIFRLAVATLVFAAVMSLRSSSGSPDSSELPGRRGSLRGTPRTAEELRGTALDLARLAAIGFLFFAHWITLFFAIKASSASIAAIGQSTYGIHLLLLAGNHRKATDLGPVLLAAIGAILVVPRFELANSVALGMLLATISAFFYATLPLLHQRWSHIPTPSRTLGQFGFALLCFSFFIGKAEWTLNAQDWAGLWFLAIGVTLIGHSLWVRVTTRIPPAVTSIIYYVQIPIAILLGVLLLDEPLSLRMILGAALIIAGSVTGLARRM